MLPSVPSRTAFTSDLVLSRKDFHRITCICTEGVGKHFYLGLSNGHVEEYKLVKTANGYTSRLLAEKRVFKHAVQDVCVLPAVQRLAVMSEEGQVTLCSLETFSLQPLAAVRGATAMTAEPTTNVPLRLVVAVCLAKKYRLLLFSIQPTTGAGGDPSMVATQMSVQVPLPSPVHQLAWVSSSIFMAMPGGYLLLKGGQVGQVASGLHCTTRLAGMHRAGLALLLVDDTMILPVNDEGLASREPLLLPSPPLALAHSTFFILIACEDGIHVFNRDTSKKVQVMDFQHDDPWVKVNNRLACAVDLQGSYALMATSRGAFCLEPIPLSQQVHDLLKGRRYEEALELIEVSGEAAATWVDIALAQAGLLLLQEARFREAVEFFDRCTPGFFQPSELFPLFPQYTTPWKDCPPDKEYWGLHGRLVDIQRLVEDLQELRSVGAGLTSHRGSHHEESPATVAGVVLEGKRHLVEHLIRMGGTREVLCKEGVDTLIVHLLCDVNDGGELETFLSGPTDCSAATTIHVLQAAGRWHALALYLCTLGRVAEALDVWRDLAEGLYLESPGSTGAIAETPGNVLGVCLSHISHHLMLQQPNVAASLVVQHLPWLLDQSEEHSLRVLLSRQDVEVADVLQVLGRDHDAVKWQYLMSVIHGNIRLGTTGSNYGTPPAAGPGSDPHLHTELALVLVQVTLKTISDTQLKVEDIRATAGQVMHRKTSINQGLAGPGSHHHISRQSTAEPHKTLSGGSQAGWIQTERSSNPLQAAYPSLHRLGRNGHPTSSGTLSHSVATGAPGNSYTSLLAHDRLDVKSFSLEGARTSSATVVEGSSGGPAKSVRHLRSVLQYHLSASSLYDAVVVLQTVVDTVLWHEQVILYCRLCDHVKALRLLALTIRDVDQAIAYCREYGGADSWLQLLDVYLRPGGDPMYPEACRVLHAEGGNLDPLKVLQSLSDDMPLHLAYDTMTRMLTGLIHRRRHGQIVRSLHKALNLSARVEKAKIVANRVVVTEDTACHGCQRLLGNRVFFRYPSGVLLCSRCVQPADADGTVLS